MSSGAVGANGAMIAGIQWLDASAGALRGRPVGRFVSIGGGIGKGGGEGGEWENVLGREGVF